MRVALSSFVLFFAAAACSEGDDSADGGVALDAVVSDSGGNAPDGGDASIAGDAEVFPDATPRDAAEHPIDGAVDCPSADDYVGDPTWPMTLTAGPSSELCAYPGQGVSAKSALMEKVKLRIAEGEYKLPLAANRAPALIPMCFDRLDSPPSIGAGEVTAERGKDFEDFIERYRINLELPLSDGGTLFLSLRSELDAPDLDLTVPVPRFNAIRASKCATRDCIDDSDLSFYPCNFTPRLCDRFVFDDGALAIEQFHWAGQVGAGFAAPLAVRGTFRGQPVDVTRYEQLTMGYGHHAFTRELYVFFDAAIDGVCGMYFPEVAEYGQQPLALDLLDCAGDVIGTTTVSTAEHLYNGGCPD